MSRPFDPTQDDGSMANDPVGKAIRGGATVDGFLLKPGRRLTTVQRLGALLISVAFLLMGLFAMGIARDLGFFEVQGLMIFALASLTLLFGGRILWVVCVDVFTPRGVQNSQK